MWDLAVLVLGFGGLWVGTELVIPATVALGKRRGISEATLGFTVLAIGSDLPELLVAVSGGLLQLQGVEASGVIVGNAVGSAITQGTLVLGFAGLAQASGFSARLSPWDGIALGLSIALFVVLAQDGRIDRVEGGVLLLCYGIYFQSMFRRDGPARAAPWKAGDTRAALSIGGGLLMILLSAHVAVGRAISLAASWGVEQSVVGVLLVGAGTSLPELALSVGAALRGRTTLSVANVIGSNVFDLLTPVGAGALMYPLIVERVTLALDLPVVGVATLLVFWLLRGQRQMRRIEAVALLALYAAYATTRVAIAV